MVHQLRRELPQVFDYAWSEADSHDVKAFLEYKHTLFGGTGDQLTFVKKTEEEGDLYNHPRIDGIAVKLPKPFIFSLIPRDAAIRHKGGEIVLYDNAGESFDYLREQNGECVTQHLQFAGAVLFAYDPLQDSVVRQRLASCHLIRSFLRRRTHIRRSRSSTRRLIGSEDIETHTTVRFRQRCLYACRNTTFGVVFFLVRQRWTDSVGVET